MLKKKACFKFCLPIPTEYVGLRTVQHTCTCIHTVLVFSPTGSMGIKHTVVMKYNCNLEGEGRGGEGRGVGDSTTYRML